MAEISERNAAITAAIQSGRTLQQVATEYGISRERVRQICQKHGVTQRKGRRTKPCKAPGCDKRVSLHSKHGYCTYRKTHPGIKPTKPVETPLSLSKPLDKPAATPQPIEPPRPVQRQETILPTVTAKANTPTATADTPDPPCPHPGWVPQLSGLSRCINCRKEFTP